MIEFSHWDIYFKPANDLFKTAAVYCERVIFPLIPQHYNLTLFISS